MPQGLAEAKGTTPPQVSCCCYQAKGGEDSLTQRAIVPYLSPQNVALGHYYCPRGLGTMYYSYPNHGCLHPTLGACLCSQR